MKKLIFSLLVLSACGEPSTSSAPVSAVEQKSAATEAPAVAPAEAAPAEPEAEAGITKAKFNKLKMKMTYKQVVAILGKEGDEISSTEIGGIKSAMYQWQTEGMGNMSVMFQNGKLINKSQFGLE